MTEVKTKILITLCSNYAIRNFIESEAFRELERNFELVYVVNEYATKKVDKKNVYYVENKSFSAKNAKLAYQGCLSMRRFPNRCATFPVKFRGFYWNNFSKKNRLRTWFLSLPLIYEIYLFIFNFFTWENKNLKKILKIEKPDFCFIPSNYSESFSFDTVHACNQLNIPNMMFMLNWDNISCKGVVPLKPDFMGVWGKQSKSHATAIHKIDSNDVFEIGSPQFEVYNSPPCKKEVEQFKKKNFNQSEEQDIYIFVGVSRYRNEMAALVALDKYISDNNILNTLIVYRPHPSKAWLKDEKNFYDFSFKNIVIDPQVAEHYRSFLFNKNYSYKSFTPNSSYYPGLLYSSAGMITSLSTLSLEAMMLGKPILQLTYPDKDHEYSFDKLKLYSHHDCWDNLEGVLMCDNEIELGIKFGELLTLVKSDNISNLLKDRSKYVLYNDRSINFSERLNQTIKALLDKYV